MKRDEEHRMKGGHTHNHRNNAIVREVIRSRTTRKFLRSPKIFKKFVDELVDGDDKII